MDDHSQDKLYTSTLQTIGAVARLPIDRGDRADFLRRQVRGGVLSGGMTCVTFRPLGHRLADTLVKHLNGEFDNSLDLNPEFAAAAGARDLNASKMAGRTAALDA